MSAFPTLYIAAVLIVFEVALSTGASISYPAPPEIGEQNEHIISEECSFLLETKTDQCSDFWAGKQAPLILISLDGFRPEYLSRKALGKNEEREGLELAAPTLNCLTKQGVYSPFMMPSYPTITFPNHYSIVTGLHPESHGIIGNQFYDPDLKTGFSIRNPDATDPKWWGNGEPIWATVRKQGKISATYFWPGSDVQFPDEDQRSPNYFYKYNKTTSFRQRVDQVLDWMDLPVDKRPALTTLYFEEPDGTGHKEGPNTANVTEKITVVDRYIRRLIDGLNDRNISKCVNIIVVSDHGMADSPAGQTIQLAKYVPDMEKSTVTFYGPVPSIRPINDTKEEVDYIGNALGCKDPHMRVFNKWELPYRMHSTQSRRIPELMLDMDLSWRGVFEKDSYSGKGAHGWDNLFPEMHAIFVAIGPAFRSQEVVQPFENVQLYNLFCALVNVTPAENNGTWGALHHLLVDPPNFSTDANQEFPDMPMILRTISESQIMERMACGLLHNREIKKTSFEIDIIVDMTEEREIELLLDYAPLGIPVDHTNELPPSNSSNYVLLINEDYVTGYNAELGVPLWAAYTVTGGEVNPNEDGIWVQDLRLELNQIGSCQRLSNIVKKEDVVYTHLFPQEFAKRPDNAWLDTNLLEVPVSMSGIIKTMIEMLNEAAAIHGPLHVVSGPTRHHSAAIFYVITACKLNSSTEGNWNLTTCPIEYRDLQSFILPIQPLKYQNCISDRDFIAFHVATLKEVEEVTDFIFFPDLPIEDKLSLLTKTTLGSSLLVNAARRNKEVV